MWKKILVLLTSILMAIVSSVPSWAGWRNDSGGFWWQKKNGSYLAETWEWLDGDNDGIAECYYFNQSGYMLVGTTTPDGYQVNQVGEWEMNGVVQTKAVVAVNYVNGVQSYIYPKEISLKVVELVNEERRKAGKSALSISNHLTKFAEIRAKETRESFSHTRPNGAVSYDITNYAENIFSGSCMEGRTSDEYANRVMQGWMSSAGHKRNILASNVDEIGVGVYIGEDRHIYIVQIYY